MSDTIVGGLATQETVADRVDRAETPGWVADHWTSFRDGVLGERNDTPFPCFFAVESLQAGDPLYTAVPSMTDADALLDLGRTLIDYLATRREHSDRASLVAFFRPPDQPLDEAAYHERLWHILQFLHVHDPEPWPADIPTDPDDPYWEFCFAGEPMFPTCRAPFYEARKSRFCPVGLEITFQPRALFEDLDVTADTHAGQHARDVIQDRLEDYDGVCPHADLGDWGVDGDREWPQYLLSADDALAPDECPLSISRDHPKSGLLLEYDPANEPPTTNR